MYSGNGPYSLWDGEGKEVKAGVYDMKVENVAVGRGR